MADYEKQGLCDGGARQDGWKHRNLARGSGAGGRERERGGPGGERSTSTRTSEAASEKGCQGVAGAHAGVPTGGWVATIRPGAAE